MKKELTIGDMLTILVLIIGWAISIEVRVANGATERTKLAEKDVMIIETLQTMSKKVDEIHEEVIRHDERINAPLPQVVTRGGIINNKKK